LKNPKMCRFTPAAPTSSSLVIVDDIKPWLL
jgi:hypothetical protein